MKDFFKYITAGEDDKDWGLYLNVVGKSKVVPRSPYPSMEHPTGYSFTWQNGRILNEYQINYITEGSGILETEEGRFVITPGTMIIIKPKVWHRYKPSYKHGWTENYIGFNGELANHFLEKLPLSENQAFIRCSLREEYIDAYYKIFNVVMQEKPGFQQVASGLIINLLGYIVAFNKQKGLAGTKIEQAIQDVQFELRKNLDRDLDLHAWSKQNNIEYSYLRKMFKKYTGFAPHQYHLELKILRAKELLLTTNKSIKEIAYELGFQSIHYFSRLYKLKVGSSPSELRDN
jgi:AraC-like DNA-binding protein